MMGEKADALISDPPYGMGLDASWYGGKTAFGTVVNSPTQHTGKAEWDESPFDPSHLIGLSKNIALFGANFFCTRLPEDGTWWVWDKHITADGETPTWYGMPFELIWMNGKHAHKVIRHLWAGFTRKASNEDKVRYHPTQKPIAVMSELIEYLSGIENIVLDPYLGSGTTMIACENTGRKCRGVEISPAYISICLQRFLDATGKTPVLLGGV
jgi:site-specific DNA-methyltransferase (adenine-specific)/modification methylase